jgi:hypothetical protein
LLFPLRPADTERVALVVELVLVVALMPLAVYAVIGAWRGAQRLSESRYQTPPPRPMQRLEADLRRLRAELEDTETRARLTAKHHRVQALRGAYIDALTTACERLEVSPPPGGDRTSLAEIYRVEAALRERGLDVRETAVR